MPTEIGLGNVAGLRLTADPSAVAGSLGLWGLLSGVAARVLAVPPGAAAAGGLIGVGLHWASALVHQLGHAQAARRTGHPMAGIRCFALLSASLYPPDEPPLPGAVHRRRALGGPLASLLLALAATPVALVLRRRGGLPWWLAAFVVAVNLLAFTLGALLPLGFSDGSTLLRWWGKP